MTLQSSSFLVKNQLPEFIAADYPQFVEFLKSYYEFLEGYSVDLNTLRDIDVVSNELLIFLRQEFLHNFPKAQIDDRKLIAIIRNLYKSKGTIGAIELLFKIFFNEVVQVRQPNNNILRASDGRWDQEYSITLQQQLNNIPGSDFANLGDIQLTVENSRGVFFINVIRFEYLNTAKTRVRFFFKPLFEIFYDTNQSVDLYDDSGVLVYRGILKASPSNIRVQVPGNNWKLGQIITIPGTTKDTLARASRIGPNGTLLNVEIIEYGYDHANKQTVVVSPYPTKPPGSLAELTSVYAGISGSTPYFNHNLTLSTFTEGIREAFVMLTDNGGEDGYFLEDYIQSGEAYWSTQAVVQEFASVGTTYSVIVDPELTYAEWAASRATLVFEYNDVIKYKGRYLGDEGQVSNPVILLQDNYFYQLFSYVIETTKLVDEFKPVLNVIHPAGLKFFGELSKLAFVFKDNHVVTRSISQEKYYLADSIPRPVDVLTLWLAKNLVDSSALPTDTVSLQVDKEVEEIALTADDVFTNGVTKSSTDTAITDDGAIFESVKTLNEISAITDTIFSASTGANYTDIYTSSDTPSSSINSIKADAALVLDGTPVTTSLSYTQDATYFSEQYVITEHTLTIT